MPRLNWTWILLAAVLVIIAISMIENGKPKACFTWDTWWPTLVCQEGQ